MRGICRPTVQDCEDPPFFRRRQPGWGQEATIALPIMIAEALATGSRDLFSGTTLALMAYILGLRIALTNLVCARLDDDDAGGPGGQRRR